MVVSYTFSQHNASDNQLIKRKGLDRLSVLEVLSSAGPGALAVVEPGPHGGSEQQSKTAQLSAREQKREQEGREPTVPFTDPTPVPYRIPKAPPLQGSTTEQWCPSGTTP